MLWEPHLEGRNVDATPFEIYFNDPFLAYVYVASIAFFTALYKAFRLLGYARRNEIFSLEALQALRTIKYCAIAIIGFVFIAEIIIMMSDSDDPAGGVVIGIFIIFGSIVVATAAAVSEQVLQKAVDAKYENDLTV